MVKKDIKEIKQRGQKRKNRKPLIKNVFKTSGICGAISLILGFLLLILSFAGIIFPNFVSIILTLIKLFFAVLFLYGFVALGKKFNIKWLVVLTWIAIIASILFSSFSIFALSISSIPEASAQEADLQGVSEITDIENYLPADYSESMNFDPVYLLVMALILLIVVAIFSAFYILFGIALLKLKDKVELAKPAGILSIIGGATLIVLGIGFLVLIAATVVEILMFFKLAKKYEK